MKIIRNLYTSSSKSGWSKFSQIGILLFGFGVPLLYLFILLADPYDSLPFSISAERAPVDKHQRYFNPMLASKDSFDSVIIGSSTIRLLKPQRLNKKFNSSFVNLAMNAASPYEQSRTLEVFTRHHQSPAYAIFSVDHVWCDKNLYVKHIPPISERDFPEWLYDESANNNLPPYSLRVFKHSMRQMLYLSGIKKYKYGLDGYTNFTRHISRYDINKARVKIYGQTTPLDKPIVTAPVKLTDIDPSILEVPAINTFATMLDTLPPETVKIVVFPPIHSFTLPTSNSLDKHKLDACKRQYSDLIARYQNSYLLDFMIESDITQHDENFWDKIHYTINIANKLEDIITDVITHDKSGNGLVNIIKGHERAKTPANHSRSNH